MLDQCETAAVKLASQADARMAEGDAIIAGAEGVGEATLEVHETTDGPRLRAVDGSSDAAKSKEKLTRLKKSPRGHKRIAAALSGALQRIRKKAKAAAEANAREELAQGFADIQAANEAIFSIAKLLPDGLRNKIAEAHKSLAARLYALRKFGGSNNGARPPTDRDE